MDEVCKEVEDVLGLDTSYAPRISAKEGTGIDDVLKAVIEHLPSPSGDADAPLEALIFDSFYDNYKGAISYVRIKQGRVAEGDKILFMAADKRFDVTEVGVFLPVPLTTQLLSAGEVGYIAASVKNVSDTRVGDTITNAKGGTSKPLPGYKYVTSMVFCGIYPADGADYEDLRDALARLALNDASLLYEPETSVALGFGFRCGFLGLLHMEIIQERLEREFDLSLVTTAPSVSYRKDRQERDAGCGKPDETCRSPQMKYMEEPIADVTIMTPDEYVGAVMDICWRSAAYLKTWSIFEGARDDTYELPLNEDHL